VKIAKLSGQDIIAMEHLTRWHMVKVRRHQTLAEHSAVVAMLSVKMLALWSPLALSRVAAQIFDLALTHDVHELEFGDIPSVVKEVVPSDYEQKMEDHFWSRRGGQPDVDPLLARIIKLADAIEGFCFYSVEGIDPNIEAYMERKIRDRVKDTPPPVQRFVKDLIKSVRSRRFTPQPTKAPGTHHKQRLDGQRKKKISQSQK
jgi:5'-deoxynucleotidase YfbR-like HD superfamily hydrolase